MCKYLNDFEIAFRNISQEFFFTAALRSDNTVYQQQNENNFSSEFVRQLRNLMESTNSNMDYYSGMHCDFDYYKLRVNIRPDIILHESQSNQNRQWIYSEVKLSNVSLTNDLMKLSIAISNSLNFNFAVMVVVNKPLASTLLEIKNYVTTNNLTEENINKLRLFHVLVNREGIKIYTIKTFQQIINE